MNPTQPKRSANMDKAIRNPWTIAIIIYSAFMTYAFMIH